MFVEIGARINRNRNKKKKNSVSHRSLFSCLFSQVTFYFSFFYCSTFDHNLIKIKFFLRSISPMLLFYVFFLYVLHVLLVLLFDDLSCFFAFKRYVFCFLFFSLDFFFFFCYLYSKAQLSTVADFPSLSTPFCC